MTGAPPASRPGSPDPLGLVIGALGFGAVAGVALQTVVALTVDALKAGLAPGAKPSLGSPHALALLIGTPIGIVLAGAATWYMLAPIRNPWRQAMLGMIAGLGSFVLSAVIIWAIHGSFGRNGMLALLALAGAVAVLMARRLAVTRVLR